MRKGTLAVLLGLLLWAVPAAAQEQRASIEGTVKDNTGAVLPGVTVEAKNLAQGSVASTVTDGQGNFRFPALSVGAYEVTASLSGFAPAKFERVELLLGQIKRLELTLGVAGVAESVQVTSEQPLIDVKQSQRAFAITADQFEKLPRGRDFSSIVTQAPGANFEAKSGGISIDGSSAGENRYIIDGVETTNPQSGVQGKTMVLDFVGEVQVKSSGYAAEFGGSTGGVINIVTRSGTNQFRGDAGFYFTNDSLRSDGCLSAGVLGSCRTLRLVPTNSNAAEYVTYAEDGGTQWDPGFGIGGPVLRDRLWFFGSYFPRLETVERTTNLSDGVPVTREQSDDQQNFSANVTSQITGSQRGKIAYNSSYRYIKGALPALNGSTSPLAVLDTNDIRPNYSVSGNYDWVVSDKFFVGARGGYYHQNQYNEGIPSGTRYTFQTSNVGLAGVPAQFQQVTGFQNFLTNRSVFRNIYGRTNAQIDATYYLSAGGQHTIKGGVQFDRIANDVLDVEQSNWVRIFWDRALSGARGTYGYYQVRSNSLNNPDLGFGTEGNIANTNKGLFIQDAWTIGDRLTLNLGLRTENESVPSYTTADGTAPIAIKWGFKDKLAPRLGFAYDFAGDGKTKIYGNWGVYYDIFKTELPRGSFGGDKWLEYYYALDTPDFTALDPSGCPPACPGRLLRGPVDFRHPSNAPGEQTIDPDIEPMKLQEAAVGFERELGRNMAFGARYIHKQIDIAIEDVGQLDAQGNEIYTIGNPGFGAAASVFLADGTRVADFPKAVRDYDALELSFDKRLADRWQLRASYTLSRLYGNYAGLSQSDENGRTSPNVGRTFDYPLMAFDGSGQPVLGRLATDRPHQFKVQAAYEMPFGTLIGANLYVASGIPVTREAAAITGSNFPVQYLGRLSDGRTPTFSQTDFIAQHEFRLGGARRVTLAMDVRNLFDQDTAISKFSTQLASGQSVPFEEADLYAGRVNFAALANAAIQDPRFLQANDFQLPRVIRFSVKFGF
jgi:hypothetical protein